MARLKFNKVTQLPAQLAPDAFYFVENGTVAESYVTNSQGVARAIGNSAMISAAVSAQVQQSLADYSSLRIAPTIAARNGMSKTTNYLVLVVDATGDATVKSGSALYAMDKSSGTFTKVAEYESMDVVLRWSSIVDGPSSTPAQIDAAVGMAHSHANKTVLDKLGADADGSSTMAPGSIRAGRR